MSRDFSISLLLVLLFLYPVRPANLTQCLIDFQNKFLNDSTVGGVDNDGNRVPAIIATALTYDACKQHCGSSPALVSWGTFTQQFSSWLLPWLALLSQLPYGANDGLSNVMTIVLAIGSPALAAFSLFMTVLNGRWIRKEMVDVEDDLNGRTHIAARVLNNLQQVPIAVSSDVSNEKTNEDFEEGYDDANQQDYSLSTRYDDPLWSLVNLRQNRDWWTDLHQQLEYPRSWSNIAISTMTWVFLAYLFTVINSFTGSADLSLDVIGPAIGSLWLWLLTIVLGWLKVSPRIPISAGEIGRLVKHVNTSRALIRSRDFPAPQPLKRNWAVSVIDRYSEADKTIFADEACSAPIYNYARLFRWTDGCQVMVATFKGYHYTDQYGRRITRLPLSRSGVYGRIFTATSFSLLLQWGTAGSAVMVVWLTPTTGLGCRSLSYLIYASLSTFILILMVLSSCSSHLYRVRDDTGILKQVYKGTAILSRYLGNSLAAINALIIFSSNIFELMGVWNSCYCDSSVLGRGFKSYNVIIPTDVGGLRGKWGGGLAVGLGSAVLYICFVWLLLDSPLEEPHGTRVPDAFHGACQNDTVA